MWFEEGWRLRTGRTNSERLRKSDSRLFKASKIYSSEFRIFGPSQTGRNANCLKWILPQFTVGDYRSKLIFFGLNAQLRVKLAMRIRLVNFRTTLCRHYPLQPVQVSASGLVRPVWYGQSLAFESSTRHFSCSSELSRLLQIATNLRL